MIELFSNLALAALVSILAWGIVDICLSAIRRRTEDLRRQSEILDRYYDLAARFLKNTNEAEHAQLRETLVWMLAAVKNGMLADVFLKHKLSADNSAPSISSSLDKEFHSLSEEMTRVFGQALGTAILASTYSLAFRGKAVRGLISALLGGNRTEVAYPQEMAIQIRPIMQKRSVELAHA